MNANVGRSLIRAPIDAYVSLECAAGGINRRYAPPSRDGNSTDRYLVPGLSNPGHITCVGEITQHTPWAADTSFIIRKVRLFPAYKKNRNACELSRQLEVIQSEEVHRRFE